MKKIHVGLISCKLHQMKNIEGFHSITNLHL